jgi:two-component system NtrC family response regulator
LIARTIHQVGRRKSQPFVTVNCASIPDTLFEREFFGHHKGAFTGADRNKPGLFDRVHQATLFLDEVTELSPERRPNFCVSCKMANTPLSAVTTPKKQMC